MSSSAFADYVIELLSPLGHVVSRRMFGGHGIYQDGLMFALVTGDVLYFKTDLETRARFVAAGSQPFSYENKRRGLVETSYWQAPDEAMESPALMLPWGRLAIEASLRKANAPVKSRRPAAKTAAAKKPSKTPAKRKAAKTTKSARKPVKPRS